MRTLSVRKCKFEKAISCDGAQNLSDWDVSFPHQGRVLPSMLIRYERDVFITIIEAEVKRALRTEGRLSFGDVDCDSGLRGPRPPLIEIDVTPARRRPLSIYRHTDGWAAVSSGTFAAGFILRLRRFGLWSV